MSRKHSSEEEANAKRESARRAALGKINELDKDSSHCYSVPCDASADFRVVEFRRAEAKNEVRGADSEESEEAISASVAQFCTDCVVEQFTDTADELSGKVFVEGGPLLGYLMLSRKLPQDEARDLSAEIAKEVCRLLNGQI